MAVQCFHEPLLLKLHSFIDGNITTSLSAKIPSFLVFAQKRASPGPADDLGLAQCLIDFTGQRRGLGPVPA